MANQYLLKQENPHWKSDVTITKHDTSVLLTDGSKYGMIEIFIDKIPEFIKYLQIIYNENA